MECFYTITTTFNRVKECVSVDSLQYITETNFLGIHL